MQTKKDKTPRNKKGEPHGYWEIYYPSGKLWFKGNYVNGKKVGIWFDYGKELFYAN